MTHFIGHLVCRSAWLAFFAALLVHGAKAQAPPNDECAGATVISAIPYSTTQDTRLATPNPSDPDLTCADGGGGKTVWFRYTPPATQWVKISTAGSTPEDYDIALGVLTGDCGSLTLVGCNDDISPGVVRQSELVIRLMAGVDYTIHIAEWNGGGSEGGVPTGGDLLLTLEEALPVLGPRTGSVPSGATNSTDGFLPSALGGAEVTLRHTPPDHQSVPLLPTPKDVRPPTAPEGSNYVEKRLAKVARPDESRAVVLKDFAGIPDQGQFIPPDPDIACGPGHLIAIVNCRFRIWDKDGTILKTITSWDWFAPALPGLSIANPPFDPQVVYDHYAGRWVVTYDYVSDTTAFVLLSVSDDADPLGTWYMWALPANAVGDSATTNWDDYPQLAYDDKALYISSNVFGLEDNAFKYARLRIIPKAQLYANTGASISWTDLWDMRDPDDLAAQAYGIQAAIPFGNPETEFLLSPSRFLLGTYFTLWSLTDVLGTPALSAVNVPVVAYSSPSDAAQLGGGTPIDAGGRNIRNQPVYRDSALWMVHSVASGTGSAYSAVRYIRFDPYAQTAVEDAAVGMDGFWHFYTALMVDEDNNVLVTFSRSGNSEYAGAFVAGRKPSDPPGLSPSLALKAGEANYVKTFSGTRNRWGDYNGIALDPAEPSAVWVQTEYAALPSSTWANQVGKVVMGPVQGVYALLDPGSLDFEKTEAGARGDTLSFTLSNNGTDTLLVTDLIVPGASFTLINAPATPLRLASFGQTTMQIAFTPQAGGDLVDSLVLLTNDPAQSQLPLQLSGRGAVIAAALPGIMYATSAAPTQSLATLATGGGAGTVIGPLQAPEIHGLAIRPNSHELYGTASAASTTTLYRISASDAEVLLVTTIPLGNMRAIAFDSEDILYAGTTTGRLYRLLAPGWDTVFVGSAPGIVYSSLAFNPLSGSLWASIRPVISFTKDALFRVDPSTGDTTLVGRTYLNTILNYLAFDRAGQLYAVTGSATSEGSLYAVDTLTAAPTLLGATGIDGITAIAIRSDTLVVSVAEAGSSTLPESYGLDQNYPNPFNPETRITYALPVRSQVRLTVYNMLGQQVARLADELQGAGRHQAVWNGRTSSGNVASSGVYIYRLEASPLEAKPDGEMLEVFVESRRMILLK
jgi:hypothetical protein